MIRPYNLRHDYILEPARRCTTVRCSIKLNTSPTKSGLMTRRTPTKSEVRSQVQDHVSHISGVSEGSDDLPPPFRLCEFQHVGQNWECVTLYYFEPANSRFKVELSARSQHPNETVLTNDLSTAVDKLVEFKDEHLPPNPDFTSGRHIEPQKAWWGSPIF